MRAIIGSIIKANKAFEMIEDGDKICVGISGGKDSMLLLFYLKIYCNMLKRDLG